MVVSKYASKLKIIFFVSFGIFLSFHPSLPLLATTSGQRQFAKLGNDSDENDDANTMDQDMGTQVDNSLRIWAAGEQQ